MQVLLKTFKLLCIYLQNNIYTPSEIESSSILLGLSYLLPVLFARATALYAFTIPPVLESLLNGVDILLLPGSKHGAEAAGTYTDFSSIVFTCLADRPG